jgi:hypothetical protein
LERNIARELLERHADFVAAEPLVDIEGLSTSRVCAFLNRLVAHMDPGEHYLEIGTWKGRTLLSAAHGNHGRVCVACDKFRFWGRFTGPGILARRALYHNIQRYEGSGAKIEFHHLRSRVLFARGLVKAPVGVFFYDGDHSYHETRDNIVLAAPYLSRRCVLLMDDWNDPEIVRATHDGISGAGLTVLWHRALPGDHGPSNWWNGLGVFFLESRSVGPNDLP